MVYKNEECNAGSMNWSVLGGVQQVLLNTYDSRKQGGDVWDNNFLLEWVDATLFCD